jgi:c-di-AMP phosphodiesterase-like protein
VATFDRNYRALNTQLIQSAVISLRELISLELGEQDAEEMAETIHNELIAAIQKFYMIDHHRSREDFIVDQMRRFEKMLPHPTK